MDWREKIQSRIAHQKAAHLYRKRMVATDTDVSRCFASNDYLGMRLHPQLKAAWQQGAELYGVGAGSAMLMCGYSLPHQRLEEIMCEYLQRPSCLLFSNGYMANLGVVATLADRECVVLADRQNHASLVDAGRLADAKVFRYPHSDLASLQKKIATLDSDTRALIVTDGVFSMTGEIAALPQLAAIAEAHHALLMVDDAHGFGVLGVHGCGVVEHFGLSVKQAPISMATFGKAAGTFGAFVAGDKDILDYLLQFSRTYMFTTAMPAALAHTTAVSINLMQKEHWRRQKLADNISLFRRLAFARGTPLLNSNTPIQRMVIGSSEKTMQAWRHLHEHSGLRTAAVRPPTVPDGQSGIRISLSSAHQPADLRHLIDGLSAL